MNLKIRELIESNYRIIYEIKDDEVIEILTVHHSARPLHR
ncbi:MAG: type II toxin-antitoxin system RelE/ParE family toxin [Microscillaceae bacterium]|nr:type II toxin-antitoxin system RelE/ParE family toxin [Microscillaceae bacterium]